MTTTEKASPYFLEKLLEVFRGRQEKNPRYSLRAYAKFLEINPGTLSAILKGKRKISTQEIKPIMKKLQLSQVERDEFVKSLSPVPTLINSFEIASDQYKVIFEDWEYFVILGLFRLQNFESSVSWVSQVTGIPLERTEECIQTLFSLGLIEQDANGAWARIYKNISSTHNVSSDAIRQSHKNTLQLAIDRIDKHPVEERDFSFLTVGLDEKHLNKLKKMILKFRDEAFELDESSQRSRLYRVSIQCFPLTREK